MPIMYPEITYIVRLYSYDSFTEEYEQYDRDFAEQLYRTLETSVPEYYRAIELTMYDYAKHTESTIKKGG